MKAKQRFLSLLLCGAILFSLFPTSAFAADTGADQAIMSGASQIQGGQADNIYFGTYQQSSNGSGGFNIDPIKWRVLSNTDGKLFLLADWNLDIRQFGKVDSAWINKEYKWHSCELRTWLNDEFYNAAFSEKERAQIVVTKNKTAANDDMPDILGGDDTDDRVFLLSIGEVKNRAYFPSGDGSRATIYTDYARSKTTGQVGPRWWLRSPGHFNNFVASVEDGGNIYLAGYRATNETVAVRPAFNLNLDSVLFTSAAADGKPEGGLQAVEGYSGNEWKLTLKDSDRSGFTASKQDDHTIAYSNAKTGDNEYISVLITDDSTGAYTHYGRLAKSSGSGTVELALTFDMTGKTLYVFNEQYNGDKMTDYASELIPIDLQKNTYSITNNLTNLTSSNPAAYRLMADSTDYTATLTPDNSHLLPDSITVTVGNTTLGTDQYTYTNGMLTIPASSITGDMTITASGIARTYVISATPGSDSFEERHSGYTGAPDEKTFTLTNNGNSSVTGLSVSLSGNDFALSTDGMATSLGVGGSTTFAVRPNTGLTAGTHAATVNITGDNGAAATVNLSFTITDHIWNQKKWTQTETHHWHECTVPNCNIPNDQKGSYGAHEFQGDVCVCGYNNVTLEPPNITGQPQGASYAVGDTATPLSVTISKKRLSKYSYQWYSNTTDNNTSGSIISGATSDTYTPPTMTEGTTYYYCVVTRTSNVDNKTSTATSDTAKIIVTDPQTQPDKYNVAVQIEGSGTASASPDHAEAGTTITLTATPDNGYHFSKWEVVSGGVTISGNTFTMPTNDVTVKAIFEQNKDAEMPNITAQPQGANYTVGDTAVTPLSVTASVSDGGNLSYQWHSNSANDTTAGNPISGATSASYTPPTTAAGTTYYYCIVTNTNNSATGATTATATSSTAEIIVKDAVTPPTHTHSWASGWTHNDTHHWHECTAADCDITNDSGKNGYGAHVYDDDTDEYCNTCNYKRTVTPPVVQEYAVTVQKEGNGTASASPDHAKAGTTITLTATPDTGYRFREWQVVSGGVTISGNTFTMPTNDVTVKAIFESDGGTTPPTHTHSWASGWTHNDTHHWHECTAGGCDISDDSKKNGYGIHVYDNDTDEYCNTCNYKRTVTPPSTQEYTVAVRDDGNGTASASPSRAKAGTTITLTATPDAGYRFREWQVVSGGVTISGNTFTMPTNDVTVKAIFESDGGTTPPAHSHSWASGWTHNDTHHWHECTAGGCDISNDSKKNGYGIHVYDNDTDEYCNTCNYKRTVTPPSTQEYTVAVRDDGNGTASASPSRAKAGTTITLTATPDAGYRFKEWQVVSGGVTISGNTFTMPTNDVTVKAIFESDGGTTPPTHTHNWNTAAWTQTDTHHWHECTAACCDITDNKLKVGYGAHVYDNDTDEYCNTCNYRRTVTQPPTKEYFITFDGNGGTSPAAQITTDGKLTSLPPSARSSYSFNGWYTAVTGGNKITLSTVFSEDTTVYAHWTYNGGGDYTPPTYISRTLSKGGVTVTGSSIHRYATLTVTKDRLHDSGNCDSCEQIREWQEQSRVISIYDVALSHSFRGTVTITFPVSSEYNGKTLTVAHCLKNKLETYDVTVSNGKATVTVNSLSPFAILDNSKDEPGKENPDTGVTNPFTDVGETSWFFNDVMFVYEKGLMAGTSVTTFSPISNTTRAQLAVIFYRMEGSPKVEGRNGFTDVEYGPGTAWYYDAVTWAKQSGIVSGYGNGTFGPGNPITREQLAAIFYRYAQYKGYDVTAAGSLDRFTDKEKVSPWAKEALTWAVSSGIVNGTGSSQLSPQGTATRAQIAAMLHRFIDWHEQEERQNVTTIG